MSSCVRHYEEPVADTCRTCRNDFCSRCLVYAFGPKKPPYCVGCALTASGVRSDRNQMVVHQAPRPTRAERKAEKAARKLAAKHAKTGGTPLAPAPSTVPDTSAPDSVQPEKPEYGDQTRDRELYEQSA